jgi:shikimate kinase
MNIYLYGMIGSGKTTVGKTIAKRLRWPFFDLDQIMEEKSGKSIHEIVAEETWLGFRQREYEICKKFSQYDCSVIGLGGGTLRYQWNLDVLRGSGVFILLTAKLKVIVNRVKKHDRPRVNIGTSLEQDLYLLWKKYKHLYYQPADLIYKTDQNKTIKKETDEIIRILKQKGILKLPI